MAEKQIALGFHNCEISVFDNANMDAPKNTDGSDVIVVDNKTKDGVANGAAQELKIDGLGGETKKQYGNDGIAFIATKSLGDVKTTLTALGIPLAERARITGAKEKDGIYAFAPDNVVPPCSMFVQSKTGDGKMLCIGLLKGKGSLGDQNLNTLDDGAPEPKGEEMAFQFGTDGREETANLVLVQAVLDAEGADKEKFNQLRNWVLRINPS